MHNQELQIFQRRFINHKNSVVKIINNTFKKIKCTKEDNDLKERVKVLKEDSRNQKELLKIRGELRKEHLQSIGPLSH